MTVESAAPLPAAPATAPATARRRVSWRAVLLVLLAGSLNGVTFSLAKIVTAGGVPPIAYAFWQCGLPGLLLCLLLRLRGRRLPLGRRYLLYYGFCALVGLGGPNVAFNYLIPHLPAGLSAVLLTLTPLVTFLLALAVGSERPTPARLLGLLCGLAGALLLVLPASTLPSPEALPWLLFAFVLPLLLAVYAVFADRLRPPGSDALTLAAGMLLAAGLLQGPAMLLLGQGWWWQGDFGAVEAALLAHVATTALVVPIYFVLLQSAGPVVLSLSGYVVTLSAILWGMVFFGERLSFWVYGAAATIFLGLALFHFDRRAIRGRR